MGLQIDIDAEQLASALQEIHPQYAYRMLALQISLHSDGKFQPKGSFSTTDAITNLTQLYMRAVEVLQDKDSRGFEYFNWKIQNLLKKRPIVQELIKENKCSTKDIENTMKAIQQAQINQRREEYDLRMSLESPALDRKKVKELIKTAEQRLNVIESRIKTNLLQQDFTLKNRIKLRKLKSESSKKDPQESPLGKGCDGDNDEDGYWGLGRFEHSYSKPGLQKRGLDKNTKRNLFSSFSQQV